VARAYQIIDEPQPGALSSIAVQPLWPLLGVMFGGAWMSWPWFVLNAFAIGSPTRGRETAIAAAGFAGNVVLGLGLGLLTAAGVVPETAGPYLYLILVVWKLAVSYWLYVTQAGTFGIYEYYGGKVQHGIIILIVASFGGRAVLGPVLDAVPFLWLVLG
jgi:hypothetical protein